MSQFLMIGIDPDVKKSGVAVRNIETKSIELYTKGFYDTVHFLVRNREKIRMVVVEASWMITKSSWHSSPNKETAARIGVKVGRNQGFGMSLVEMIKGFGIPCREQRPLTLRWGKDGKSKITHADLKKISAFKVGAPDIKVTNQEQRDAVLLIL